MKTWEVNQKEDQRENQTVKRLVVQARGKIDIAVIRCRNFLMQKEPGIDGILVTVGLCIIALVLCVIMKDRLGEFITSIMGELTSKAEGILNGPTGGAAGGTGGSVL